MWLKKSLAACIPKVLEINRYPEYSTTISSLSTQGLYFAPTKLNGKRGLVTSSAEKEKKTTQSSQKATQSFIFSKLSVGPGGTEQGFLIAFK